MKKRFLNSGKLLLVLSLTMALGGITFAQATPASASVSPPENAVVRQELSEQHQAEAKAPVDTVAQQELSGAYQAEIYALAGIDATTSLSAEDADLAAFCAVLWYADRADRAADGMPEAIPGDLPLQEYIATLSAQVKNGEFPAEKMDAMQQRVQAYLSDDGKSVVKPPLPEDDAAVFASPAQTRAQAEADAQALREWRAQDAANQEAKKAANGGYMGCTGTP